MDRLLDPRSYEIKLKNVLRKINNLGFDYYVWEHPEPPWIVYIGLGCRWYGPGEAFIMEMEGKKAIALADAGALERYIIFHFKRIVSKTNTS